MDDAIASTYGHHRSKLAAGRSWAIQGTHPAWATDCLGCCTSWMLDDTMLVRAYADSGTYLKPANAADSADEPHTKMLFLARRLLSLRRRRVVRRGA
jgi:hypothetical protein